MVSAPTRFSSARVFARDLGQGRNSLVRNSGVRVGSRCWKRGSSKYKKECTLHGCFGGYDGFGRCDGVGGSGEQLAFRLLVP